MGYSTNDVNKMLDAALVDAANNDVIIVDVDITNKICNFRKVVGRLDIYQSLNYIFFGNSCRICYEVLPDFVSKRLIQVSYGERKGLTTVVFVNSTTGWFEYAKTVRKLFYGIEP